MRSPAEGLHRPRIGTGSASRADRYRGGRDDLAGQSNVRRDRRRPRRDRERGRVAARGIARRRPRVLGLEQFELGHDRGASQDQSRITRLSYHRPEYVELAIEAQAAWREVEAASRTPVLTMTGGLDLAPPDAAESIDDYARLDDRGGRRLRVAGRGRGRAPLARMAPRRPTPGPSSRRTPGSPTRSRATPPTRRWPGEAGAELRGARPRHGHRRPRRRARGHARRRASLHDRLRRRLHGRVDERPARRRSGSRCR